ncbi:hypothetical protein [Gemella morbillorum]
MIKSNNLLPTDYFKKNKKERLENVLNRYFRLLSFPRDKRNVVSTTAYFSI